MLHLAALEHAMSTNLTSFITVFDGIIVSLEQFVKIPLSTTARLCDHSFLVFELVPETSVGPSISQLVQHLIKSTEAQSHKSEGTFEMAESKKLLKLLLFK